MATAAEKVREKASDEAKEMAMVEAKGHQGSNNPSSSCHRHVGKCCC